MSLRARLLAAVGVVALVALVVASIVTYSSLKVFLVNRIDQQLLSAVPEGVAYHNPAQIPGRQEPFPLAPGEFSEGEGGTTTGQSTVRADGQGVSGTAATPNYCPFLQRQSGGAFLEIRSGSTVVCQTPAEEAGGKEFSPKVPSSLTVPTSANGLSNATFFNTSSTTSGGPEFRVLATRNAAGQVVIVGAPLDSTQETLHQLLLVELAVSGAALVAAISLGWWLVRVGLRPLAKVEETAEAIANGAALDRRIPGDQARTEVGRLARVLNLMLSHIQRAFAQRDATEQQLRQSEERMRQFVADASHELRTPLAAVSAYAELFGRGAGRNPADLDRVMRGIQLESARMKVLVEDLVLLARLDEGRPLDRRAFELVALASDAVLAARAVGPEWPLQLEARRPVEMIGDPQRIRQVLDNLLSNVRAHTPPGTPAALTIEAADGFVTLQIIDRGPGMTADEAHHIFERFYRIDPSRSRHHGGAGLGLSIVAAIVASHGGSVCAASEPGQGTAISVRLPIGPPASASEDDTAPPGLTTSTVVDATGQPASPNGRSRAESPDRSDEPAPAESAERVHSSFTAGYKPVTPP